MSKGPEDFSTLELRLIKAAILCAIWAASIAAVGGLVWFFTP